MTQGFKAYFLLLFETAMWLHGDIIEKICRHEKTYYGSLNIIQTPFIDHR